MSSPTTDPSDAHGTPLGIELILPDWFYAGVLDAALVLTIDPARRLAQAMGLSPHMREPASVSGIAVPAGGMSERKRTGRPSLVT